MLIPYYYFIKMVFFFSLVRSLVRFDPLKKQLIFLGLLYTAAVAFLSYVFLLSWQPAIDWRVWEIWLGKTFLLATFYFWLLVRFEEGILFWVLILLGFPVVLY
jgi:hypothetical protein